MTLQSSRVVVARAVALAALSGLLAACSGDAVDSHPQQPCGALPAQLSVPVVRSSEGEVAHWPLKPGCLPVSYDPGLAERAPDLEAAVTAWASVGCSTLCFQAPRQEAVTPGTLDRRLHFAVEAGTGAGPPSSSLATLNIRRVDGAIVSARVNLLDATVGLGDLVRLVGESLGLGEAAPGTDSALARPSTRLTPSDADVQTVCALYGKPALCSD
jgi:hypothetical protein